MSQNEKTSGMFTDPPKDQGEGSGGAVSRLMHNYKALAYPEEDVPFVSPALRSPVVTSAILAGVIAGMGGNRELGERLVSFGAKQAMLGQLPEMCADLYRAARKLGREGEVLDLGSGLSDGADPTRSTNSESARHVDLVHY